MSRPGPAAFLSIRMVRAPDFLENLTRFFSRSQVAAKFFEYEEVYKQGPCAFRALIFDTQIYNNPHTNPSAEPKQARPTRLDDFRSLLLLGYQTTYFRAACLCRQVICTLAPLPFETMVRSQVSHNSHNFNRARSRFSRPFQCRQELVTERYNGSRDLLDILKTWPDKGDECIWYWRHERW